MYARVRSATPAVVTGVAILATWALLSTVGVLDPDYFPSIVALGTQFVEFSTSNTFWDAVAATIYGWGASVAVAGAAALVLGIVVGSVQTLYDLVRGVIELLRPIPSVAIIPLVILLLGPTLEMKIVLATYAAFWPLLIQTIYGVRSADPVVLDTARSFGLGRVEILYRVTLPSALPYVATGLRISAAIALILCVTTEIAVGAGGLGREILLAQNSNAIAAMYALIVATGLLGLAVNELFRRVERRTMHWHTAHRTAREAQ